MKPRSPKIRTAHEARDCLTDGYQEPYTVYGLVDPRDQRIRYIGLTYCTRRRMNSTTSPSALSLNDPKALWLRELLSANEIPALLVLEEGSSFESMALRERFWIALGRTLGWPLTNVSDGGDGMLLWNLPDYRKHNGRKQVAVR